MSNDHLYARHARITIGVREINVPLNEDVTERRETRGEGKAADEQKKQQETEPAHGAGGFHKT